MGFMDNLSSLGLDKKGRDALRAAWILRAAILALLLLSGCRAAQIDHPLAHSLATSPTEPVRLRDVPFAVGSQVDEIFPLLIAEERVLIAARDLEGLAALWDTNAQIIDQRSTEEPEDDYIWRGIPALLDRYELAVFPFSPPPIEPPSDLVITCRNGQSSPSAAEDENETACLEIDFAEGLILDAKNGGDLWSFVYREGRWWLLQLRYN